MIIQILLILGFIIMLINFLAKSNTSQVKAWKKIIGVLFAMGAIIAVLFPRLIDSAAKAVGVGRGADLLLYTLSMAFIASEISAYVRRRQDHQQFVRLARRVAIIEANNRRSK